MELLYEQVTIVSKNEIMPFINRAEEISPDPKNSMYFALAIMLEAGIWSNDKKLKSQNKISIFMTEELIEKRSGY